MCTCSRGNTPFCTPGNNNVLCRNDQGQTAGGGDAFCACRNGGLATCDDKGEPQPCSDVGAAPLGGAAAARAAHVPTQRQRRQRSRSAAVTTSTGTDTQPRWAQEGNPLRNLTPLGSIGQIQPGPGAPKWASNPMEDGSRSVPAAAAAVPAAPAAAKGQSLGAHKKQPTGSGLRGDSKPSSKKSEQDHYEVSQREAEILKQLDDAHRRLKIIRDLKQADAKKRKSR